ncbi:MAG: hypothetical protein HY983_02125 [Candidatus Magasanikbacteria bacterium]|nr:hypothetical protein [Candidatus Magasanikbacteria bacterium]
MEPTQQKQRTRCEVWTRVMGYHRPVSHFNIGKKSEHYSRKHFTECQAANSRFIKHYAAFTPTSSNTATA